jgi:hypothetical protein
MGTPSKDKQHQAPADVRALRLWAAWQRAGWVAERDQVAAQRYQLQALMGA